MSKKEIRTFPTGATRDVEENKLDWEGFLSPVALWHYAAYMHKHRKQTDGSLRASDNWQRGMSRSSYMKSLIRHVFDLWMEWEQDKDEGIMTELLAAIIFNAQGLLYELALARDVKDNE